MTGKELILYILQNNLENEVVLKDGQLICFLTDEEVAIKFNVGLSTIKIWRKYGYNNKIGGEK